MKRDYKITFDFQGFDVSTRTSIPMLLNVIKSAFNNLINNTSPIKKEPKTYKDIIYLYEFYKNKIEELEYRYNPQFNLVYAKTNENYDSILAKVKWNYPYKGEKRKKEFITVFISSTKKFPKGLDEPTIEDFAREKIYELFYKNAPIELIDASGNPYKI